MAGPKLEIFKFGLYLSLPIAVMVYFSKPEWYTKQVLPYRDRLFPPPEKLTRTLPVDQIAIKDALAQIKIRNKARKREIEGQNEENEIKN